MSAVPLLDLNPPWLSGVFSYAIVEISLFSKTRASILPAMERWVMPSVVWTIWLFSLVFVQKDNDCIPEVLRYSPFLRTVGEQILERSKHCFYPILIDFCCYAVNERWLAQLQLHCGFLDLFTGGWIIKLQLHIYLGKTGWWWLLHGALVVEEAVEMLWPALEGGFFICPQGRSAYFRRA